MDLLGHACVAVDENNFIGKYLQRHKIVSLALLGDGDKDEVCF